MSNTSLLRSATRVAASVATALSLHPKCATGVIPSPLNGSRKRRPFKCAGPLRSLYSLGSSAAHAPETRRAPPLNPPGCLPRFIRWSFASMAQSGSPGLVSIHTNVRGSASVSGVSKCRSPTAPSTTRRCSGGTVNPSIVCKLMYKTDFKIKYPENIYSYGLYHLWFLCAISQIFVTHYDYKRWFFDIIR
jgi:hypothetical protein